MVIWEAVTPRHDVTVSSQRLRTLSHSLTWHQALALIWDLAALGFERWNDDGAGVPIVVVVQDGGLCVVAVVVGGSGLHRVRAVVAGAVGVG